MLQNLKAEMVRYGVTASDLALVTNRTVKTINWKISGKYDFTLTESKSIRDKFFPGMSLEYLFSSGDPTAPDSEKSGG